MTAVTVRGPLAIGGTYVRCPGRGIGTTPRQLTLIASGQTVMATCGEKHRQPEASRLDRRAQCFFPVDGLTPANLATLARGKPGKFRLTLPGGRIVEGTLAALATGSTATAKAAAAVAAKNKGKGKGAAQAPAKPTPGGRATGGAFVAAMNAIAAVAGAAGQTAAAVGQTAVAVGKGFDMGREGVRTGRAAIQAADNAAARRFARANTSSNRTDS